MRAPSVQNADAHGWTTMTMMTLVKIAGVAIGWSQALADFNQLLLLLGMRTRISCLAPASQCVRKQSAEAARSRALLTAREARLCARARI